MLHSLKALSAFENTACKAHKRNHNFKFMSENQYYIVLFTLNKLHDRLIRVFFECIKTILV